MTDDAVRTAWRAEAKTLLEELKHDFPEDWPHLIPVYIRHLFFFGEEKSEKRMLEKSATDQGFHTGLEHRQQQVARVRVSDGDEQHTTYANRGTLYNTGLRWSSEQHGYVGETANLDSFLKRMNELGLHVEVVE